MEVPGSMSHIRQMAAEPRVATLLVCTILFGAIYGSVLCSWHGARLAIYVAIKVPLLMLSTAAAQCVSATTDN